MQAEKVDLLVAKNKRRTLKGWAGNSSPAPSSLSERWVTQLIALSPLKSYDFHFGHNDVTMCQQ